MDVVRDGNRHIAREALELVYIWDSERARKTEIVGDINSVEYI